MGKEEKFVTGSQFVIPGIAKWAALYEPDEKFEPCWKINVVLDDDWNTELRDAGFNVRVDADGDNVLIAKTKVTTKAGKKNFPPTVVGPNPSVPFTKPIGNGSKVKVKVFAKYCEVAGKTFLPAYLNSVQVIEHVEYEGGDSFSDESGPAPF